MNDSPAELELIRRARRGDRDAFALLHEQYAGFVHGIVLAHAPLADVEDARQEVFLTCWRRLETLRDVERFGPWIASIARRTGISFQRRRLRRLMRLSGLARPARESFDRRIAAELLEEIRLLPQAYREPLILRLVEQMSGEQIAARTGLTPGSVRVNLHRGMRLLRERLEDEQ